MEFVVYVLFSERHNKLYIGYSSDLINRFASHNHFASKGFSFKYRPWKVIHVEFFETKQKALQREMELKGGKGREWLRNVILNSMKNIGFISY